MVTARGLADALLADGRHVAPRVRMRCDAAINPQRPKHRHWLLRKGYSPNEVVHIPHLIINDLVWPEIVTADAVAGPTL